MHTIILVSFIDQIAPGTQFKRSRWPLHMTLVPWMDVEHIDEFTVNLKSLATTLKPVRTRAGHIELFGKDNNLPVNIISPDSGITDIHMKLLELCSTHAELRTWRFVGSGYRPHITQYDGRSVSEGDELDIDNISLIELTKDPSVGRVREVYEL